MKNKDAAALNILRLFVAASSDMTYRMSADWSQMLALDGRGFLGDTINPRLTWLDEYIPVASLSSKPA